MKCPCCGYKETDETEDHDTGKFWNLTDKVRLERRIGFLKDREALLKGCPACKKVFVDDHNWQANSM